MRAFNIRLLLSLALICAATPFLGACHTMAGAGEDISRTGTTLENSADKHAP